MIPHAQPHYRTWGRSLTAHATTAETERWFDDVACPLCGDVPFRVLYEAQQTAGRGRDELVAAYHASSDVACLDRVVECERCGLVRLHPRPRADVILDGYRAAVDETFVAQDAERIRTFERTLKQALKQALQLTAPPVRRHLDVGCAGGACLVASKRLGLLAEGVEPSVSVAAHARTASGAPVFTGTLEEARFEAGAFDLVSLWDVLEHVPQPGATLDEVFRVTRPQGSLVVSYPAWDSLPRRALGRRWPFLLSVHLTYFTRPTLQQLLARHGFSVVGDFRLYQTLKTGYLAQRAARVVPALSPVAKTLARSPVSKVPFTYYMGQRVVVARRA